MTAGWKDGKRTTKKIAAASAGTAQFAHHVAQLGGWRLQNELLLNEQPSTSS
jgi:hypothetical protein